MSGTKSAYSWSVLLFQCESSLTVFEEERQGDGHSCSSFARRAVLRISQPERQPSQGPHQTCRSIPHALLQSTRQDWASLWSSECKKLLAAGSTGLRCSNITVQSLFYQS